MPERKKPTLDKPSLVRSASAPPASSDAHGPDVPASSMLQGASAALGSTPVNAAPAPQLTATEQQHADAHAKFLEQETQWRSDKSVADNRPGLGFEQRLYGNDAGATD